MGWGSFTFLISRQLKRSAYFLSIRFVFSSLESIESKRGKDLVSLIYVIIFVSCDAFMTLNSHENSVFFNKKYSTSFSNKTMPESLLTFMNSSMKIKLTTDEGAQPRIIGFDEVANISNNSTKEKKLQPRLQVPSGAIDLNLDKDVVHASNFKIEGKEFDGVTLNLRSNESLRNLENFKRSKTLFQLPSTLSQLPSSLSQLLPSLSQLPSSLSQLPIPISTFLGNSQLPSLNQLTNNTLTLLSGNSTGLLGLVNLLPSGLNTTIIQTNQTQKPLFEKIINLINKVNGKLLNVTGLETVLPNKTSVQAHVKKIDGILKILLMDAPFASRQNKDTFHSFYENYNSQIEIDE